MPNQYNAVSLTPQTYPFTTGSNTSSGVFPQGEEPVGSGVTDYDPQKPVDESVTRRPKPNASGVTGAGAVALTTAFDGGAGTAKVVDHVETQGFTSNEDPYAPGGGFSGTV